MRNLNELKEEFSEEGILLTFNGPFTHGIIEEIGNATRRYLEGEKLERGVVTDVFAVYIEQTQNVCSYLKRNGFEDGPHNRAIVVVGYRDGYYTVCSGNSILSKDVEELNQRLEDINSRDKTGLKKMYKEQLRKEIPPDASGAGLGLIDMARRAARPLRFRFDPQENGYQFFSLFVTVAGG
jgi:hypothetical protein